MAERDKNALVAGFRTVLRAQLDTLGRSSGAARDGTRVDGDHRPANRGERGAVSAQGYLAHGLAVRMAEIQRVLELLDDVNLSPTDRVRTGALVVLEDEAGVETVVFIVPGATGDRVDGVTLISPSSPLARALVGREEGDEVRVGDNGLNQAIVAVS